MKVNWNELQHASGDVIVVEDNPLIQTLLEEMLTEIGFSSVVFDNAVSALTHLKKIKGCCALIIADYGLPGGMTGSEFLRAIEETWPSTPAILTSGYPINETEIPPSAIYLHKPFTLDQLESSIAIALFASRPPVLGLKESLL